MSGAPEDPRATVQLAVDAGMNVLRVPGLCPYEDARFFEVCDELGVLVWHDLALANLDVPHDLLGLDQELTDLLDTAGGHPSLAVVCGGSETAQQVAMLGLDPTLWETDFLTERAPRAVADQAIWVGNSPVGGALPFRVGEGVAHWFGVGGYRRPLSDVRTSNVLFASECLAFANPSSKGDWVPRDNGATWDFADVVDHYAHTLDRPRETVVGDLMAHVFGDWRRAESPNRGDLRPGHGWGVLESDGTPKPPYHALAKILAPQAIWFTDEGLDGVHLHVANDRSQRWTGTLRLTVGSEELEVPVDVEDYWTADVEGLLGRFVDASYAFRFGDPQVTRITAELGSVTAEWVLHRG
jgi:beta-mannosidase